ncbi:MAG: hypothetical protein V4726_14920 [Verrucomicrobiota bacterium]
MQSKHLYREVPNGDHYDSMIEKGIPAGIAWLKKLDKKVAGASLKPKPAE